MLNYPACKLWVDALRSGKYKKGVGCLAKAGSYCCLGVACEVAIENGVSISKVTDDSRGYSSYDGESTYLPKAVANWLGIPPQLINSENCNGLLDQRDLVVMNDSGDNFEQIAERIDKECPNPASNDTSTETPQP